MEFILFMLVTAHAAPGGAINQVQAIEVGRYQGDLATGRTALQRCTDAIANSTGPRNPGPGGTAVLEPAVMYVCAQSK